VYEGSPTPVAGYMSAATKAAGFAALMRVLQFAFPLEVLPQWQLALAILAALTMIVGNVVAVAQTNIKRMLAYSSIAHAGYILVAVVAASEFGIQSVLFLVVMAAMGLFESWWSVLLLPAALLIGFCFGGLGLAVTTHVRSWVDFDKIQLAIMPMFLFSATFFPLEQYGEGWRWVVRATPLYHGVALLRGLTLGDVGWSMLGHVLYLAILGTAGMAYASRHLRRILLH